MTALALDQLVHVYPSGVRAIDGVDLRVDRGERVALVGQNGSGKTTLARHLNGLLRPTSGRVLIDDRDASEMRVAELARRVGLAFQNPDDQIFASSVRREVEFGARNAGHRGAALESAAQIALGLLGLDGFDDENPYDLGYSRRKLLTIASVIAMGTPILVLDEPTTGQDAPGVELIGRIVASVAGEGRTVVAISHDMRFVAEHFERVVVMRQGRIVRDGTPRDVFAQPSWETLATTFLEPPFAARAGAALGLGSTPTEDALGARSPGRPPGSRARSG
jgi:energy-coupling factor transport system ATP-binding protein